jgi:hypothetical protein
VSSPDQQVPSYGLSYDPISPAPFAPPAFNFALFKITTFGHREPEFDLMSTSTDHMSSLFVSGDADAFEHVSNVSLPVLLLLT